MRKFILITMCAGLFLITGCKQQKRVPQKNEIQLSFMYREVVSDSEAVNKFEYRNTSTPDYMLSDDMWYKFRDRVTHPSASIADAIGDGHYYIEKTTSEFSFRMLYKPAIDPEPDDVYVSRKFKIVITGVCDSIWRNAEPLSETVPYLIE